MRLVNVPLVALLRLHLLDVDLCFLRRLATLFLHNRPQRGIYIFRHLQGVATNIEVSSGVEPAPKFGGIFLHLVLHINLMFLIPREGAVQLSEKLVLPQRLELIAIIIVVVRSLGAEEKPVPSPGPDRAAFL